jgi:hypothetical protein
MALRSGRPKAGTPAGERQRVIDALGLANLGGVDLMRVRTQDDADRVIARHERRTAGPTKCTTSSGTKIHYAKDRHRTLCGFKIMNIYTSGAPALEPCIMCMSSHLKEAP